MATFFTSDTHFGHASIINLCKRPYTTVQEMDEALIANWNDLVRPGDTVYHLGDFAFRCGYQRTAEIAGRLNGEIRLIEGNHEEDLLEAFDLGLLNNVTFLNRHEEIKVEGQKIVLCHYAMRTWHHDLRGVWHLYGHSHGGLAPLGKSVDVGVDVWNFAPVSFDRLKEWMDGKTIHPAPKFEGYEPKESL